MPVAAGGDQKPHQLVLRHLMVILRIAQAVSSGLQTADRFLESLLIGLSDAHDLAYCTHLGSQLIFHAFEFLKSPAGKFDYHIIAVRYVFIQGAVFTAGDFLQRKSCCQHGRHQGNWEACGL